MTYQALARKWRPRDFDHVVGQQHVLRAMKNSFSRQSTHHAYLFTGTRGVGKTSLARILARCFNCEQGVTASPCGQCGACEQIDQGRHPDLHEVDAASRAKVEETRELMDKVPYAPVAGRYKVYIIDEVHMFSNHSFNALLKVLEEPPEHVRFLLATTEPKKIPATILSRCIQFGLRALSEAEINQRLQHIMQQEEIPCEEEASALLARAANGSLRDALSLLDQAISYGDGQLQPEQVRQMLGTVPGEDMTALLRLLVAGDGKGLLEGLDAINRRCPDYGTVLSDLMNLLQDVAIEQLAGGREGSDTAQAVAELAQQLPPEQVQLMYQIALHGKRDLALAPDPGRGFEMCMLRMLAFQPATAEASGEAPGMATSGGAGGATPAKNPAAAKSSDKAPPADRPEASAPATMADPGDLREMRNWAALIERSGLVGMERQLADNCLVTSYENDVLELRLHGPSALAATEGKLGERLRQLLGPKLKLKLEQAEPQDEVVTPASLRAEQQQQRQRQQAQSIADDPHVRAVCETLDAKLAADSAE